MKARFDTLFGRLFGVLFVAIVLAHLLAFAWFRLYGPPPPHRRQNSQRISTANRPYTILLTLRGKHAPGSVGRWCR